MSVSSTAPTLTLTRTAGKFEFYIGSIVTNANLYRIQQDTTASFTSPLEYTTISAPLVSSKYSVTGLTPGTTYYYRIRAERTSAPVSSSSWSISVSNVFANVPTAVASITPTPANASVSISYTPPSNGGSAITGYKVERSVDNATWTQVIASTTANPYTVTGLTNGILYYFRLTAINALGSSTPSSSVSATPRTIPGAPTSVVATATGPTTASVSFVAPAPASNGGSVITGYIVTPYIGASAQATSVGSSSPITISGLTTGQIYTFRVQAVNVAGSSAQSTASGTTTLVYNSVSAPSGATFTYSSSVASTSSKVTYTNIDFSDVIFTCTGSAWGIVRSGQMDTLIGVRKVVLRDRVVYFGGSGANSGTVISGSSTVGSYTMNNTNTSGANFIASYITDALAEFNATPSKTAVIYLAGDTIYTPTTSLGMVIQSPIAIVGVTVNSKKPLISRFNQDLRFMNIRSSNVRLENLIFDLFMSSSTEINAGALDIGWIIPNLTLLENITIKDVDMVRGHKKGVNMNYVSNITFDGCNFTRVTDGPTIRMTSCKNVTVKNSTIPRSANSQRTFGSIYINTSDGPRDIYNFTGSGISPQPTQENNNRGTWTDSEKLTALRTTNIDISENNTFTDEVVSGTRLYAMILLDTYKSTNGSLQYELTYRGATPDVKLPAGFSYAFTHDTATGITIPTVYITKNSTDILGDLSVWFFEPSNVTVRRLDTGARIYPVGYELPNTSFDASTISTESEIPIKIAGSRTIVPVRSSFSGLTALDPVFVTGQSATPKLAIFTDGNVGTAVKSSIDKNIGAVVVQRTLKGTARASTIDIKKRSDTTLITASKTTNGQTQTATADVSSLPATHSVLLSVEEPDMTTGVKANVFLKIVDGNGNLVTSGVNIPVEFSVPGTEAINALDLYRYETTDFIKVGVATKKTGSPTTFVYTFTTNSDYQLREQPKGGGIGDPYIRTLGGEIYKLPAFNGYIRLYQGIVDGKQLTINAQTRIDDNSEEMDQDSFFYNKKLTNPIEEEKLRMTSAMSFFERIYIDYDSKDMCVNIMNGFQVEKTGFAVSRVRHIQSYLSGWMLYQHLNGYIFDIQITPTVVVRVGIIPIRSIRNSVEIIGIDSVHGNGAIVHKLSKKAMVLKKLSDKRHVEERDFCVKRYLTEVFVSNRNPQVINIPYIG